MTAIVPPVEVRGFFVSRPHNWNKLRREVIVIDVSILDEQMLCEECNGTGKCDECNGTGTFDLLCFLYENEIPEFCDMCFPEGSGKCSFCSGTGKRKGE